VRTPSASIGDYRSARACISYPASRDSSRSGIRHSHDAGGRALYRGLGTAGTTGGRARGIGGGSRNGIGTGRRWRRRRSPITQPTRAAMNKYRRYFILFCDRGFQEGSAPLVVVNFARVESPTAARVACRPPSVTPLPVWQAKVHRRARAGVVAGGRRENVGCSSAGSVFVFSC
jgi:hypothetical protein